ncbi:multisubunit sodium/proton antiporter, MrpE subunit [Geodermatophilus pulveris]|uniref:Multisubunit sodium/proton antiporter, MrpE subunit n=1 Tax=Geodermatophilus pulveris TaxID=1564159 RepID=A0A239G7S7_9ACTN|nr:Na+/H+ antiporter subunit E [Geodermatophilus pulveris]SNS65025.1 multisubunit sodium/proton antiporter, MrpE subunit [Geodermatophilus pulveris]
MSGTATDGGVAVRLRHQLPLLLWLVLVWNLLWGTWSWANLISGVAVALVVTLVLPLPPVVGGVRVRPVALLTFLGTFLADLARAGALVAWQTVRPRGIASSAILRVELRTDSDLLISIVTEAVTLVPGSMVIEIDREHRVIGLHVLSVESGEDLDRQRRSVLLTEERVVRAFGTAEEIAALQRPVQPAGRPS